MIDGGIVSLATTSRLKLAKGERVGFSCCLHPQWLVVVTMTLFSFTEFLGGVSVGENSSSLVNV